MAELENSALASTYNDRRKMLRTQSIVTTIAVGMSFCAGVALTAAAVLQEHRRRDLAVQLTVANAQVDRLTDKAKQNDEKIARLADSAVVIAPLHLPKCPSSMVQIPGGDYRVAETSDAVKVGSFCLDVTEVTVAAYQSCVARNLCSEAGKKATDGYDSGCNDDRADRQNHPVNCVDWKQATTYCEVLGERLPTNAEWEWAARGGELGWQYPWGNVPDIRGRTCSHTESTCPVGSFTAGDNPWGVHDLSGNVLEWTATHWHNKPAAGMTARGGQWMNDADDEHSAGFTFSLPATAKRSILGFRCAATLRTAF